MAFEAAGPGCKIQPMKTITSRKSKQQPTPAAEPAAPPKFTPRGSSKNRILIAVQDGKIDFSAMSSEAAKTFNELMHNPDVQAQFNIGPLRDRFDPQHCKRIYEALGLVMVGFAKMAFKWPAPALQHLIYTEEEKNELAEPTATVLDELAPKWLKEHQALAALVLVFSAMTQQKFRMAAATAQEIIKAQRAAAIPVTQHAPAAAPPAPAPMSEAPRAAGSRKVINITEPNPTPAEQVNLGPVGGPEIGK